MNTTNFSDDFKRNLLTGVAALFPILVTLFLFTWLGRQLHRTVGWLTKELFAALLAWHRGLFRLFYPGAADRVVGPGARGEFVEAHFPNWIGTLVGILLAVVAVYVIGQVLRSFLGHRMMRAVDQFFNRFPVIKMVYPHARQVGDFLFGQSGRRRFNNVVAVQYPRLGLYTLGFQTGDGVPSANQKLGRDLVSVFIPTSPTPLTGFVILVPVEEVVTLEMSMDEAFRFCITAGMLSHNPEHAVGPLPPDVLEQHRAGEQTGTETAS